MDSRNRNGVGRFVWRLAIIVAGTVALGLLLVIGVAVTTGSLRFVPAGAFVSSDAPTFAATVGSTVPDMAGRRLDGTEDSLSAYRGRIVLLDIWATWCKPCVDALPELRQLAVELPAERFTLLAISVDFDRETVLRFMENEPMPWVNWHAGFGGGWGIRRFPTYVLIDEHGLVLDRTNAGSGSAPAPGARIARLHAAGARRGPASVASCSTSGRAQKGDLSWTLPLGQS